MPETPRPNPLFHRLRALASRPTLAKLSDRELLKRFAEGQDEQAFQALMERHGPMVLRVCRRALGNQHDAEDAFQATFFVLARKAGSGRWQASVANWLYGVACRVAQTARRSSVRRKIHEPRSTQKETGTPLEQLTAQELLGVLDQELSQLPDKFRSVLVQVYLEGKSQDEAARELGLTLDVVKKRLQRGRGLLEARLTRRGVSLPAALAAILFSENAATATVPTSLAAGMLWAVRLYQAGQAAVGAHSAASALATAVLRSTTVGFVRPLVVAAGLLLFTTGGAAIGLRLSSPIAPPSQPLQVGSPIPDEGRPKPALRPIPTKRLTGQVRDVSGRPVPHAAVAVLARRLFQPGDHGLRDDLLCEGQADADGHFQVDVPTDFPAWQHERRVTVVASAAGHATATLSLQLGKEAVSLDVSLPAAGSIRGRLLASDGKLAAGVRVSVVRLGQAVREPAQGSAFPKQLPGWPADAVTDADGYFAFAGVPDDNIWVEVQDDRFAQASFSLTPLAAGGRGVGGEGREVRAYTLAPARLLSGRVTAAATGRPVAARLSVFAGDWEAHHDRYTVHTNAPEFAPSAPPLEIDGRAGPDGRFRLRLPAEGPYRLTVQPLEGEPFVGVLRTLDWVAGEAQRELEIALPSGVEVKAVVTETDGRPVARACVYYLSSQTANPHVTPDLLIGRDAPALSGPDGVVRLAAPLGRGVLLVYGPTPDFLPRAYDSYRCRACGRNHRRYEHARVALDLSADRPAATAAVELRRGVDAEGRVLAPGGVPMADGILVSESAGQPLRNTVPRPLPFRNGVFVLPGCAVDRVYPVIFFDPATRLAALAEVRAGQANEVRLEACGSAEVRLVDGAGRPVPGARASISRELPCDRPVSERSSNWKSNSVESVNQSWFDARDYLPGPATGEDGRVRLSALVPGAVYVGTFTVGGRQYRTAPFRAKPGEALRLPDVVAAPSHHDAEAELDP